MRTAELSRIVPPGSRPDRRTGMRPVTRMRNFETDADWGSG